MHTPSRLLALLALLALLSACSPSPWLGPFTDPDGAAQAPDAEVLPDAPSPPVDASPSDAGAPLVFARVDARREGRFAFFPDAAPPTDTPVGDDAEVPPPDVGESPADGATEDHTALDAGTPAEDVAGAPDIAPTPDAGDAQEADTAPDAVVEDRHAGDASGPTVDAPSVPDAAPPTDTPTPRQDVPPPDAGPSCALPVPSGGERFAIVLSINAHEIEREPCWAATLDRACRQSGYRRACGAADMAGVSEVCRWASFTSFRGEGYPSAGRTIPPCVVCKGGIASVRQAAQCGAFFNAVACCD